MLCFLGFEHVASLVWFIKLPLGPERWSSFLLVAPTAPVSAFAFPASVSRPRMAVVIVRSVTQSDNATGSGVSVSESEPDRWPAGLPPHASQPLWVPPPPVPQIETATRDNTVHPLGLL